MDNIVIPYPENLEKIKKDIKEAGKEKFHLLTNFDNSLTKAFVDGEKIPSIISQLRNGKFLTEDYAKKAHELYDKYHAIEDDPNLSREQKIPLMQEWWRTHYNLLVKLGLTRQDIEDVVEEGKVEFREGFLYFLDILKENNIPIVIMSATGLGDAIPLYLKKHGRSLDNVHIISNFFDFDGAGKVVKIREPIIHSMNKKEVTLEKSNPEIFDKIRGRKNVILIGDRIEDIGMIEGFEYENLIKIGFLNDKADEKLERYKEAYDIIILNDGSFGFVNILLKEIL